MEYKRFLLPLLFFVLVVINLILYRHYRETISKIIVPIIQEMSGGEKGSTGKIETRIILGGDVMLGRSVLTTSEAKGDFAYPFLQVKEFLKEADLVFVNLEAPVLKNCPRTNTGMVFCTDPKMIKGLLDANINMVNLENNHILNYGQDGLSETKRYLSENNVEYVGFGKLVIKEINNTRFGFLGFDFLSRSPSQKDLDLVSGSKEQTDVLIVSVHWGSEYQKKAGSMQRNIAKELVGNGADIVVGHHPHWVQDFEKIENGIVYYSLGNFVFDQMWSEETKQGLLVELIFKDKRITKEVKIPVYMKNIGQPYVVDL